MAADVRKDETDPGIENGSVFSDSEVERLSSISLESDYIDGELPSYAIVHQQMRDILEFQKAAADLQLRSNINSVNSSKHCLNNTLECQARTIKNLEVSIQNDYVLKDDFIQLEHKLEEERDRHKETQTRLADMVEKLESCKKESVAALTRQRETERAAFEKCCDSLREDVQDLKSKNREMQLLLKDKNIECDELKSQLMKQKQELSQLRSKHEVQKIKFRHKVSETEVEKQQEAYLRQMSSEDSQKRKNWK